ncbi:MAG: hypothetical protein KDH96_09155 [Candidatus Riesia sp.]|nr:hypothetical protein [Candidatus Riesia sp.]
MKVQVQTTGQETHPFLVNIHEGNNPLPPMPEWLEIPFNRTIFNAAVALGVPIKGFKGAVEVNVAQLNNNVPVAFPDRTDADGNVLKWKDYKLYHISLDGTKALIRIDSGKPPRYNRLDVMTPEELQAYIDVVGVANVLTLDEARTLYNTNYRIPEEGDPAVTADKK